MSALTLEQMILEMHMAGKRVELHNHKTEKVMYRWSCTVGRTMKCGFRGRDPSKRDWWRYFGESPLSAVQAAYTEYVAGKHNGVRD